MAPAPAEWALGVADEVWWSRRAQPPWPAWAEGTPSRRQQLTPPTDDPDPKAIAGDGLLRTAIQKVLIRFVAGRPVSHVTTAFLGWVGARLPSEGNKALLLVGDHASGPRRQEVRAWSQAHHRQAKRAGSVRLVVCQRPIQRPWLNRLEPPWLQAKRAGAEPGCRLSKAELISRICAYFNCPYVEHLQPVMAKQVA